MADVQDRRHTSLPVLCCHMRWGRFSNHIVAQSAARLSRNAHARANLLDARACSRQRMQLLPPSLARTFPRACSRVCA
eukprot:578698-Pleurochrysis_carterae.AAC.1